MTARPPEPLHDDLLSAEERELAVRLAKLDAAAGPSAALDARILAAARAATPARRVAPRWPRAFGAAAVLVAAVGLAWQLKPMFALPPPPVSTEHAGTGASAGAESDVVVEVRPVPRVTAMAPAATGDAPAQAAAPAAARKAAPTAGGGAPAITRPQPGARAARVAPPARRNADFVDEAVPPPSPVAAAPAVESRVVDIAAPSAAVAGRMNEPSRAAAPAAKPPGFGDIRDDARLPLAVWLARVRVRRDAGDLDGARASLARFVATHPRARIPADLQPLLHDGDPWGQ